MKPLAPIHWPYLGDGILAMAGLSLLRSRATKACLARSGFHPYRGDSL